MITQDISLLDPAHCQKEMSQRYVLMNTKELVENILALTSKGEPVFQLRQIQFGRTKSGNQFQISKGSHFVRIQTVNSYSVGNQDDVHPELIIKNSYDGSSQFEVRMGIFRLVCSNGLVISTADFGEIKLRHMGTPAEAAFDIVKQFATNLPKFQEIQQSLTERILTDAEKVEFALKAAQLRFNKEFSPKDAEILLQTTHSQDVGNDMWKVFNVIQGHLTTGSVKLEGMKKKSRPINRAYEDVRINKALFELAMEYVNGTDSTVPDPVETFEPIGFEEIRDFEDEIVERIAKTIPEKSIIHPGTGRKIPNPAYNQWLKEQKELGLIS